MDYKDGFGGISYKSKDLTTTKDKVNERNNRRITIDISSKRNNNSYDITLTENWEAGSHHKWMQKQIYITIPENFVNVLRTKLWEE